MTDYFMTFYKYTYFIIIRSVTPHVFQHNAMLVSMSDGEKIEAESDPKGGIYVIVSGLVKVSAVK